jgi:IS605 OrfB family transposase
MQTCGNKLAERSKLRNQMRKYQKELKTLKNMTDEESNERKKILRKRISVLAKKLEGKKKLKKLLNKYKNKETTCICSAIKEVVAYIKNLDTKVLVVLENLDVNDFKLGRENNRMVSMWSRAKIVKKLEETLIAEGIEVVYVDPAYTSQACPKCHNVNKKNRDGEEFLCTCCGHQADADNNAGVNISKRYGDIEVSEVVKKYAHNNTLKHKEMRKIFAKRHREYLKNAKNGELNIN